MARLIVIRPRLKEGEITFRSILLSNLFGSLFILFANFKARFHRQRVWSIKKKGRSGRSYNYIRNQSTRQRLNPIPTIIHGRDLKLDERKRQVLAKGVDATNEFVLDDAVFSFSYRPSLEILLQKQKGQKNELVSQLSPNWTQLGRSLAPLLAFFLSIPPLFRFLSFSRPPVSVFSRLYLFRRGIFMGTRETVLARSARRR